MVFCGISRERKRERIILREKFYLFFMEWKTNWSGIEDNMTSG